MRAMKRTFVLVILDGWGLGEQDASNPIHMAEPGAIGSIGTQFPAGALQAAGIAVGLPWEEVGSSEVGHLTIGSGKILYQHLPRISIAIDDGTFFTATALRQAFAHARTHQSAVHLVGLLTDGNVHASRKHLLALIELARRERCTSLYLQLFSDGRDGPPRSVVTQVASLKAEMAKAGVGEPASVSGRYYAMDRDGAWDRTERTYRVLTDPSTPLCTIEAAAERAYARGFGDEFIEPAAISGPNPIRPNDAVIFFNFRADSMYQLSEAFLDATFKHFKTAKLTNLYVATMTRYREGTSATVAFPPESVGSPLGKVLADQGRTQLRLAESKKYPHVTYFFNGLREEPFPGEFRVAIPSLNVLRQQEHPSMMARAITDRALAALGGDGEFDFLLINYANVDVIAHTGDYDATVAAVLAVDREVERLVKAVLAHGHLAVITADHGNAEMLLSLRSGQIETGHTMNPVPFYLVAREYQRPRISPGSHLKHIGLLSDVAPTILALMGIEKPLEMTGQNLLDQLART